MEIPLILLLKINTPNTKTNTTMLALLKKELHHFFSSAIGYVFITCFLDVRTTTNCGL